MVPLLIHQPRGALFPICIKGLAGTPGAIFSTLHTSSHLTLKQSLQLDTVLIPIFTNEETNTETLFNLPKILLVSRGAGM